MLSIGTRGAQLGEVHIHILPNALSSMQGNLFLKDVDAAGAVTIINDESIQWESSPAGALPQSAGSFVPFLPTEPGRYAITATYNGQTAQAVGIAFPSAVAGTHDSLSYPRGVHLSDFSPASSKEESDIWLEEDPTGQARVLVYCRNGAAILENPLSSVDFAKISCVPEGLTWETLIPSQERVTLIVRDGNGGYAKVWLATGSAGHYYAEFFGEYSTTTEFHWLP